jgi:hypothetical protein
VPYALPPYQPGVVTEPESEIGSGYYTLDFILRFLEARNFELPMRRLQCLCVATCTIVVCRMKCKIRITRWEPENIDYNKNSSTKITHHDAGIEIGPLDGLNHLP